MPSSVAVTNGRARTACLAELTSDAHPGRGERGRSAVIQRLPAPIAAMTLNPSGNYPSGRSRPATQRGPCTVGERRKSRPLRAIVSVIAR